MRAGGCALGLDGRGDGLGLAGVACFGSRVASGGVAASRPQYVIASAAIAVIVIAPWAARNWLVLRAPVFLRITSASSCSCQTTILAGTRREDAEAERYRAGIRSNAAVAAELRAWASRNILAACKRSRGLDTQPPRRFVQLTTGRIWMGGLPVGWWSGISLLAFVGLRINRRTMAGKAFSWIADIPGTLLFDPIQSTLCVPGVVACRADGRRRLFQACPAFRAGESGLGARLRKTAQQPILKQRERRDRQRVHVNAHEGDHGRRIRAVRYTTATMA